MKYKIRPFSPIWWLIEIGKILLFMATGYLYVIVFTAINYL